MKRTRVNSSCASRIGYDPKYKVLEVEYQNGKVYQYFRVPESVYKVLMSAHHSIGKLINTRIKRLYPYRKVESH